MTTVMVLCRIIFVIRLRFLLRGGVLKDFSMSKTCILSFCVSDTYDGVALSCVSMIYWESISAF